MRCPTCNTEFDEELSSSLPFCSERCRSIDMRRWLDESYGLPRVPDPEADETSEDNWTQQSEDQNANGDSPQVS